MTNPLNPLLIPIDEFIDYQAVRPEHIEPALDMLVTHARQDIEKIVQQTHPTWDSLVEALHDATERLWRAWSVSRHLNAVEIGRASCRESGLSVAGKRAAEWYGGHRHREHS